MPEEQLRITVTPSRPDEVFIHLPEFTYWDTQAWSAELGIPASALPALRAAVTAHLDATTPAEPLPVLPRAFPTVKGRCPACGLAVLFLGEGGYVTCSNLPCPDPDAASTLLKRDPRTARAVSEVGRG